MKKQLFILLTLFLPFICIPSSAADKTKNQKTLWEEAVEIEKNLNSKALKLTAKNINLLNFNQIPKNLDFNEIWITFPGISNKNLEEIFKKVPKDHTIQLFLIGLTITEGLWNCISENAEKINTLDISFLKNEDTDFTLAWPNLLKNSNDNLKITLYDNFNKKHLALQDLFTKLADNKPYNKNYTLNLTFDKETNINLPPTENKISSVKKLKFNEEFSLENVKNICKLFNIEQLKEIEFWTKKTNEEFLNDIEKNKDLVAILKEFDHLKLWSTSQQQEKNLYKKINKKKWLTKKTITYSALALGAIYLTYRLFFAKSKQPAINLKKNLSDNPQKIFTFIPSQQKKQLAIDKLRNK